MATGYEHLGKERRTVSLYGVIDEKGNEVIRPEYDQITELCGLYRVKYLKHYGLKELDGADILQEIYDDIFYLHTPYIKIKKDTKWAMFDVRERKFLTEFIYNDLFLYAPVDNLYKSFPPIIIGIIDNERYYFSEDFFFHRL